MEYFWKQNARVLAVAHATIVLIDPFIKIILLSRVFGWPRLSRVRNSFFFPQRFESAAACSKRRSISSMSARSTPNCTSQIGHRAKRRSIFCIFITPEGHMRGVEERARIPPGIIEKSRVSRCGCGDPGRASLVPDISAA